MKSSKIRIVIADDHQLIRETWKLILEQDERFEVIGECINGAEAIVVAQELSPDIMLLDINMHPVNGFEATKKIVKQSPTVRIIGISVNDQPSYARNMLQLGARGFMTKDCTREEMSEAVMAVYNGGKYICEDIRKKMDRPDEQ